MSLAPDDAAAEPMSIGLVHDYLLVLRGAERTFAAMADRYAGAPIYTLLYDATGTGGRFRGHPMTTSYLQRLGASQDSFRRLLPLFADATRRLPVSGHDVILSSSSAFAHGVRAAEGATHVCYCYTPFRYAWFEEQRALAEMKPALRPALRLVLARSRRWDLRVRDGVTRYVAISQLSRERIARYLGRDAEIVHPPVEIERFSRGEPGERFLVVCELVAHKRVDLALEAARRAGAEVDVVGSGPERQELEARYGDVATFYGRLDDDALAGMHASARALLLPNVEEFGIAAVEAQAAGRPVVAAAAGGALETVLDGVTGVLVEPGDVDAMAEALREVDFDRFDPVRCEAQADRFSSAAFQQRIDEQIRLARRSRA